MNDDKSDVLCVSANVIDVKSNAELILEHLPDTVFTSFSVSETDDNSNALGVPENVTGGTSNVLVVLCDRRQVKRFKRFRTGDIRQVNRL